MTTLTTHLLQETEVLSEDDRGGGHLFSIRVDGISATAPKKRKLLDAISATGVPRMREAHPYIEDFIVRSREVVFEESSPTSAVVRIIYDHVSNVKFGFGIVPGLIPPVISVDSTVQEVQTEKDVKGNPIVLKHTFVDILFDMNKVKIPHKGDAYRGGVVEVEPNYSFIFGVGGLPGLNEQGEKEAFASEIIVSQKGTVSMQLPFHTVTYTRMESGSPGSKSRRFTGTINSRPIFGDPKHFWLCTKIGGTSQDEGATYQVTYEFQRHPEGWDPDVVFIDGETGKPLVGSSIDELKEEGALLENLQVIPEADFRRLNI